MKNTSMRFGWIAAAVVALAGECAFGDVERLLVTSIAPVAGTRVANEGEAPEVVTLGQLVSGATFDLDDAAQVMLYSPSGRVALTIRGAAHVRFVPGADRLDIAVQRGEVTAASETPVAEQPVYLSAVVGDKTLAEVRVGPGWTSLSCDGAAAALSYRTSQPDAKPLSATLGGKAASVAANQTLTVQAQAVQTAAAGDTAILRDMVQRMGIESARIARGTSQAKLFDNITQWDRRSGEKIVVPTLVERPRPEARVVALALTTPPATTSVRTTVSGRIAFAGANEVPTISPAALAVGVNNVTALNANAATLLTQNGSQGIGSLSQLAIQGFLNGIRTIGPPGLAAP